MVKKISHEKFESMLDRILNNDYPLEDWYPTMKDAVEMSADPVRYYEFILWILESNQDMKLNEEQKEVEKYLQRLLRETTRFI